MSFGCAGDGHAWEWSLWEMPQDPSQSDFDLGGLPVGFRLRPSIRFGRGEQGVDLLLKHWIGLGPANECGGLDRPIGLSKSE